MIKIGSVFAGQYGILEKIDSGGMADIYRVQDLRKNRRLALKVLREEYSKDERFIKAFEAEGLSAKEIDSPYVVRVYEVSNVDNIYYLVMEYVDGITLKEYIDRRGQLSGKETVAIAGQIAVGLRAIHLHHIIHRDIKPKNIILSKDGKVKITDFGIALTAFSNPQNFRNAALGSAEYMAPEQTKNTACDERSDLYSLGISMYEMIAGRVPFKKETSVATALAHMNEKMTPPTQYNPDCPKGLEQIIFRCTQKAKERRYHNATELLQDLKILSRDSAYVFSVKKETKEGSTQVFTQKEVDNIRFADRVKKNEKTDEKEKMTSKDRINEKKSVKPKKKRKYFVRNKGESVFDVVLRYCILIFGAVILSLGLYVGLGLSGALQAGRGEIPIDDENSTVSIIDDSKFNPETDARVPNLVGLSLSEAMEKIKEASLNFKVSAGVDYSDSIPLGNVTRQNYEAGVAIPKKTVVTLVLSAGSDHFTFTENYVGKHINDFRNAISSLSDVITVIYKGVESDTIPTNQIISMTPSSGTVTIGDTITVTYSRGPKWVTVPDLKGMTLEEAKEALSDAGLKLGEETEEYSSEYEAGIIIGQGSPAKTNVRNGSSVDVIISLGGEDYWIPENLIGLSEEEVKELLDEEEIPYEIRMGYYTDEEHPLGKVYRVTPGEGETLPAGRKLKVYIATDVDMVKVPNLAGEDLNIAIANLTDDPYRFELQILYADAENDNQINTIKNSLPVSGNSVPVGSIVTLTVYKQKITMKDVHGRDYLEAKTELENAGFIVSVDFVNEGATKENNGKIIGQSLADGTPVTYGTEVTLTVYKYQNEDIPPESQQESSEE